MALKRNENEYRWLSDEVLADIEKELNPGGLAFRPLPSWSCPKLESLLKEAYRNKFPEAAYEPQYKGRALDIATSELNKILEERLKKKRSMSNIPIDSWREARPVDEPFNPTLVGNNINVGRSPPAQAQYKKHNSPLATTPVTTQHTLPSQSQYTAASSSTSVSTGRGTGTTLNGNNGGPLLHQRNTNSPGPSPGRGAVSINGGFRSRRGRGSHRSGQPRAGTHLCPWEGCGKSFQYPSKLKDHEHTHQTAKDFSCRLGSCTKSFKRMRELKAHEKIIHPGHPSEPESESRDQEMLDVGEAELVQDQKKLPGRRDEDSKVEIEDESEKDSPSLQLRRPSNKISEAEVASPTSSPPTPNARGTAIPGSERLPSPEPERLPERLPSPGPERPPSRGPERLLSPEPEQRPSQPPVRPPPPDPPTGSDPAGSDPALPVMLTRPEKSLSPPPQPPPPGGSEPQKLEDTETHMRDLAARLLLYP